MTYDLYDDEYYKRYTRIVRRGRIRRQLKPLLVDPQLKRRMLLARLNGAEWSAFQWGLLEPRMRRYSRQAVAA